MLYLLATVVVAVLYGAILYGLHGADALSEYACVFSWLLAVGALAGTVNVRWGRCRTILDRMTGRRGQGCGADEATAPVSHGHRPA